MPGSQGGECTQVSPHGIRHSRRGECRSHFGGTGGEWLQIARVRPSDVLVLDEYTSTLDLGMPNIDQEQLTFPPVAPPSPYFHHRIHQLVPVPANLAVLTTHRLVSHRRSRSLSRLRAKALSNGYPGRVKFGVGVNRQLLPHPQPPQPHPSLDEMHLGPKRVSSHPAQPSSTVSDSDDSFYMLSAWAKGP